MTNKNNKQARRKLAIKQLTRKVQQTAIAPKKKKQTPFADVGSIIGGGVGSMFGLPYAKGVGKWLGTGIGSIFGSGDYEIVGQQPAYNVLTNGAQIPKFSTTRQTNIVSHREYLGDITGTAAFTNRTYPINPGSPITFPWLSTLAQNYQQYKIHGLIFEFRPLITDFVTSGAPGVVVMATNYNADEPAYTTKQEMENSEYAVSVKPTNNLMHGVECASNQTVLNELYVRPAALASNLDLKFTDLGNFQFASQGNPVQLLGELWCSYTIEFFKPILPKDVGGNVVSMNVTRTGVAPATPMGASSSVNRGDLPGFAINSGGFGFTAYPGNYYLVTIQWAGTVANLVTYPGIALGGLAIVPSFNDLGAGYTINQLLSPVNGVAASTTMQMTFVVQGTGTGGTTPASIVPSAVGTYPTGVTTVNMAITSYSTEAVV